MDKKFERNDWQYIEGKGLRTTVYTSKAVKDKLETLRKKLGLRSINEAVNFILDKYLDLYIQPTDEKEKKPVVIERRY